MSRRKGQDLGPYVALDAEAAQELKMVAPGLGITHPCGGYANAILSWPAGWRWRNAWPASPDGQRAQAARSR